MWLKISLMDGGEWIVPFLKIRLMRTAEGAFLVGDGNRQEQLTQQEFERVFGYIDTFPAQYNLSGESSHVDLLLTMLKASAPDVVKQAMNETEEEETESDGS